MPSWLSLLVSGTKHASSCKYLVAPDHRGYAGEVPLGPRPHSLQQWAKAKVQGVGDPAELES